VIRESLYFSFDGRKSSDYGILNVSISNGLYEEPFMSSRSIREIRTKYHYKPFFQGIDREPLSFTLSFAFEDTWDDKKIQEIVQWLNVDYYKPLFFSENIDKVYYAMPVDDVSLIHNGLKQGYLQLTMRCDSPYAYSHFITSPIYDASLSDELMITIENMGDCEIYPEIYIQKIDNGDISIFNLSNGNKETKLSNLVDGEEIYIDCENEIIQTSLQNKWRYDDFNDQYLSFVYGINTLRIVGKCKLYFRYRFRFL
jgi:predicted phage tail component-like protein